MTATVNHLFSAALALDASSRLELAERLWDAVQTQDDSIFSEETWAEIGRRVAASDAGEVEHMDGRRGLALVREKLGFASA